jgi:DNA (cytosine-5)-methyltransferase 1
MPEDKPKLLDLFCCAGGASMGYHLAGFEVIGVDIEPQFKYPFELIVGDALEVVARIGRGFDAIHASPPCQAYSMSSKQFRLSGTQYPDLVAPTREALKKVGKPWVIENVPGSPLVDPVVLCGAMFGLKTYRHRLFESSFTLVAPEHPAHVQPSAKMGRAPKDGEFIQVAGHFSGVPFAQEAMGIPWMGQKELAQAIPPAYTRFVGQQLMRAIRESR